MNKALAEIIAGVIPHKMTRNRWRGILRYGLWNALKLKWRLKRDKSTPKYYLAVCAIAKNEHKYINEWVKHYLSINVDHIYIFDNDNVNAKYIGCCIDKEYKDKITINVLN